jgi:hypothetical protein
MSTAAASGSGIPLPYKLFFLYIEPISALAGAYHAAFEPQRYLEDLRWRNADAIPTSHQTVTMSLSQLANLYLLFALNEHLVLSSTPSLRVWKRLLFCLLIADLGHLFTILPVGLDAFWAFSEWNAMMWGSIGFVYLGATMRMCFLLNVGLGNAKRGQRKKSSKSS